MFVHDFGAAGTQHTNLLVECMNGVTDPFQARQWLTADIFQLELLKRQRRVFLQNMCTATVSGLSKNLCLYDITQVRLYCHIFQYARFLKADNQIS